MDINKLPSSVHITTPDEAREYMILLGMTRYVLNYMEDDNPFVWWYERSEDPLIVAYELMPDDTVVDITEQIHAERVAIKARARRVVVNKLAGTAPIELPHFADSLRQRPEHWHGLVQGDCFPIALYPELAELDDD